MGDGRLRRTAGFEYRQEKNLSLGAILAFIVNIGRNVCRIGGIPEIVLRQDIIGGVIVNVRLKIIQDQVFPPGTAPGVIDRSQIGLRAVENNHPVGILGDDILLHDGIGGQFANQPGKFVAGNGVLADHRIGAHLAAYAGIKVIANFTLADFRGTAVAIDPFVGIFDQAVVQNRGRTGILEHDAGPVVHLRIGPSGSEDDPAVIAGALGDQAALHGNFRTCWIGAGFVLIADRQKHHLGAGHDGQGGALFHYHIAFDPYFTGPVGVGHDHTRRKLLRKHCRTEHANRKNDTHQLFHAFHPIHPYIGRPRGLLLLQVYYMIVKILDRGYDV